jgi:hypothetical protein
LFVGKGCDGLAENVLGAVFIHVSTQENGDRLRGMADNGEVTGCILKKRRAKTKKNPLVQFFQPI